MSNRRLTTIVLGAVFGGFAVWFLAGNVGILGDVVAGIGSIDPTIAALGTLCSGLAIANRGALNRAAHRSVGLDVGQAAMTHTAAVGFAAQKVVKSAGAVGLAVFVRHGRRRGHAPGQVAAACVLAASASFAALGVLLSLAVAALAIGGRLTGWWVGAAIGFSIYSVLVVCLAVAIARSRPLAESMWEAGEVGWRRLRRRSADHAGRPFPAELFDAIGVARRRPEALGRMMAHAIASKLLGALMLAAAVDAAGLPVSAGTALVIYATALAASMVTIVPGGVGMVEASTAALLVAAGASAGAAALAVALFRLFDLWLPLLTGAVLSRGDLRLLPDDAGAAATGAVPVPA